MAKYNQLYKLAKYIDETNTNALNDPFLTGLTSSNDKLIYIDKTRLLKDFSQIYKQDKTYIETSIQTAEKLGILDVFNSNSVITLRLSHDKGLSFVQKRWIIPTGLIRAIFEENKNIISGVAAITLVLCAIIAIVVKAGN